MKWTFVLGLRAQMGRQVYCLSETNRIKTWIRIRENLCLNSVHEAHSIHTGLNVWSLGVHQTIRNISIYPSNDCYYEFRLFGWFVGVIYPHCNLRVIGEETSPTIISHSICSPTHTHTHFDSFLFPFFASHATPQNAKKKKEEKTANQRGTAFLFAANNVNRHSFSSLSLRCFFSPANCVYPQNASANKNPTKKCSCNLTWNLRTCVCVWDARANQTKALHTISATKN